MATKKGKQRFTVEVSKEVGYCFGVERSVKMAKNASKRFSNTYSLGPLIHNPDTIKDLEKKHKISVISDLASVQSGALVIRAHGLIPRLIEEAREKGLAIVDTTCPFVKKSHELADKLVKEGYHLVIIGEKRHPEVIGILAHAGGKGSAVEAKKDIDLLPKGKPLGVIMQSTQDLKSVEEKIGWLLEKFKEIKIYNTVCEAVTKRQKATLDLARRVDMMVIVGGKNSANTGRLTKLCSDLGVETHHIENASEIRSSWFSNIKKVGVSTGTSTPNFVLEDVLARLTGLSRET